VNATRQAQSAYGLQAQPIRTHRGTEYDAFARITCRLKAAVENAAPYKELAAALHENRRLWALLAADAAGAENGLPGSLRARIVGLAEFTRRHSAQVLSEGASAAPLIEVNTAVMQGLRTRAGAA